MNTPMAGRNFVQQQALERDIKELYLKISSDGAGNFTVLSGTGIYSIAKTGVGTIRVYLEDKYPALRAFNAIIIDATERDFDFQIKAHDVAPTSGRASIDIFTLSSGAETDLPTCDCMFEFILKNTTANF